MSAQGQDGKNLTRKQQRAQARAQRTRRRTARAPVQEGARRRRRLNQLAALLVTAIVIIGVLVGLTSAGSNTGIPTSSAQVTAIVGAVSSLLDGIPQSGNTIGNPNAPVALQYFGDLECSTCRAFTLGALPALIRGYVRAGKLKITYRSLQTATSDPRTFKTQQVAALAAGRQNKLWTFVELFYHEQGEEGTKYVTDSYLQKLARQVPGLDLAGWTAARSDPELATMLATDARTANSARLTSTPSFLIGKTGGAPQKLEYDSLSDPSSFNAAIEHRLKG
jgi:protein-disulfide isomerase